MSAYDSWPTTDAVIAVPVTTVWASPEASRSIDESITQAVPRPERWVSSMGTPERLDLLGRVSTQALMGEPVLVVDEKSGWSEVRLPWQLTSQDEAGYPGWIPSAHIQSSVQSDDPLVCLQTRLRYNETSNEILSVGSVLRQVDPRHLRTPSGELVEWDQEPAGITVLAVASRFLGVSYLWGGMSGWGVDCSGLVHVSARACGVMIDRDSTDQFTSAVHDTLPIDPDGLRWFAHPAGHERAGRIRHVAFALPNNKILHAPRTGFSVEVIDVGESPYDADAVTHLTV
jgi:gamma-D-glutamyl-L-lysine dipeptidyl-peptidase